MGVARTYARIKDRYYFPDGLESVARYVSSCKMCQHQKGPTANLGGHLQTLRVNDPFWQTHMDFYGLFTVTQRCSKCVLLAVCPLTKVMIAKAMPHAASIQAAQFFGYQHSVGA